MKKGIRLVFQKKESGIKAETITVYSMPLEKGDEYSVLGEIFLPEACAGTVISFKLDTPGCYVYTGTVRFTEEDEAKGEKIITYSMDMRKDTGYEPVYVSRWTPEIENSSEIFSVENLKNVGNRPDTPAFSPDKGLHRFTTAKEAVSYLKKICQKCGRSRLFFLDQAKQCPVFVLSSEAAKEEFSSKDEDYLPETLLQAIAKSGKLKVLYQAQLHGNEPAAGEGALAVCRALSEDLSLTEVMDVIIVPFANVSGALKFSRWEHEKLDLNRDALLLRSEITREIHKIFTKIMPEIFIDGHEFSGRKRQVTERNGEYILDSLDDVLLSCLDNLNRDEGIFETESRIMVKALEDLREKGFRSFFYPGSWAANTSCGYARLMNAQAYLIESNGIRRGKLNFERRVLAQREAVLSILYQAAEQAELIRGRIKEARLSKSGRSEFFVTAQETDFERRFEMTRQGFDFCGRPAFEPGRTADICCRSKAAGKIRKPEAFYLLKESPGAKRALEILKINGAVYIEKETAYIFPMGQTADNLICASFAEELGDVTPENGSFLQAGLLKKNEAGRIERWNEILTKKEAGSA